MMATSNSRLTIRERLFLIDPYEDFDHTKYPYDPAMNDTLQGGHPIFRRMVEETKPKLIIEVGTWKGGSAISMAEAAVDGGYPSHVLTIDSFSGTAEMWLCKNDPDWYGGLRLKNGYPHLYYQALANFCHAGLAKRITPLPMPSNQAADLLRRMTAPPQADLIYVDGSHLYADVFADVVNFAPRLSERGVMFGHDWDLPDVHRAVRNAASELGMEAVQLDGKFWRLK